MDPKLHHPSTGQLLKTIHCWLILLFVCLFVVENEVKWNEIEALDEVSK
jgi:hypothetical protein